MAADYGHQRNAEQARRELDAFLLANRNKSLLRLLTCGSVDDGKSTLIGRLLFDSKALLTDQLSDLESESRLAGKGGELDLSLLVDGLAAEREQGITIDVAYRFFATDRRKFIIADTPGHEQYTRNMVTAASTADLAIILIDARKGVLRQTRRHSYIAHLLGIRNVVLAINKMDLVDYSQGRFDEIIQAYRSFARELGISEFTAIPISAKTGDNVVDSSAAMPWYEGRPLLEHLETAPKTSSAAENEPFRMPVQWVSRPDQNFRGYAGTVASGSVWVGDPVTILPSGRTSHIERIVTFDGDLEKAVQGQAITLTLRDEVDCSRGDMIVAMEAPANLATRLEAHLIWMAEQPFEPHRTLWLKAGTRTVSARIGSGAQLVDIETMEDRQGDTFGLNDIGRVVIDLDRTIPIVPYQEVRELGGFVLIDKVSNATVAAGTVRGFSHSSEDQQKQAGAGRIFWIEARSGAERSSAAHKLRRSLSADGHTCYILDEATLRSGLCADLALDDRQELIRRAAEAARLISFAHVCVILDLFFREGDTLPGEVVEARAIEEGEWRGSS